MPKDGEVLSSAPRTTAVPCLLTVSSAVANYIGVKLTWSSFLAWTDTEIILDVADPDYINTLAKGSGVTGDMSTSDGGKTWTVTTIQIPEFTF